MVSQIFCLDEIYQNDFYSREDLRKPLFSGVFARIRLYLVPAAIPNDINGQAAYWKNYYNSAAGAGTVADFKNKVNDMNNRFGSVC